MRALGIGPIDDTRATFRACAGAMARPGTVQESPAAPADRAVIATLVDHEVTLHSPDERLTEALADRGRLDAASAREADIVHALGSPAWNPRELRRGSLVEPSEGATAVIRVERLAEGEKQGAAAAATTLVLRGPGVPGRRTLRVGLPPADVAAIEAAQSTFPRGIDVILTAGKRLAALPRSVDLRLGLDGTDGSSEIDTSGTGERAATEAA